MSPTLHRNLHPSRRDGPVPPGFRLTARAEGLNFQQSRLEEDLAHGLAFAQIIECPLRALVSAIAARRAAVQVGIVARALQGLTFDAYQRRDLPARLRWNRASWRQPRHPQFLAPLAMAESGAGKFVRARTASSPSHLAAWERTRSVPRIASRKPSTMGSEGPASESSPKPSSKCAPTIVEVNGKRVRYGEALLSPSRKRLCALDGVVESGRTAFRPASNSTSEARSEGGRCPENRGSHSPRNDLVYSTYDF